MTQVRAFLRQQDFSPRNLKYMRAFAESWRETLQQSPSQKSGRKNGVQTTLAQTEAFIVHQTGAQLPWKHHCLPLEKLISPVDRLWYASKAVEHGWSRNVLAIQIEVGSHQRQGSAVTNFKITLPPPQSDLAQGITKDPCRFDFLKLRE